MTTNSLQDLLNSYREAARTERDKGTYFERLSIAYLTNDPVQVEQYEDVKPYAAWAIEQGWDGRDTGIDLVAKLKDEDGYAAIQCKFYDAAYRIRKEDIDSFISASGKEPFKRRVIIDTTERTWSENAETMIRGQAIPTIRIGLNDLQESPILWETFSDDGEVVLAGKKTLRTHQKEALRDVRAGLTEADRGKMIMACGTGKTFTSLKIAEDLAGQGKLVLFLVPSLALMAQTVREWTGDTATPLRSFAVCSDTQVGKRRASNNDIAEIDILDLAFPASTDAAKIAEGVNHQATDKMTVVFATYQSIQVIADAQKQHDFPEFDLIICDEAHRTTGATLAGEDESNFVKVHDNDVIQGNKRLYMTATPRIFGDNVKAKADEADAVLASMDDEDLFGKTLFYRGFSWAVQNNLLTDYKVIVLAMDEGLISTGVQKRLADSASELVLDDATKIVGCYKALTKTDMKADVAADPHPMRRALAFCKDIRSSKLIRDEFSAVVDEFLGDDPILDDIEEDDDQLRCEIEHVDGTFNAKERGRLLDWLKADASDHTCRILTNARCLSEGVDVPALDAIMFLHPRKSQIDVVQSVGRVMRKTDTKKMGYVILPVGVPAGVPPEQALADNEKFRVVWQILNALRAHDDRFDATINKASLGQDVSGQIEIIGITGTPEIDSDELKAVTAVVEDLPTKAVAARSNIGTPGRDPVATGPEQTEMAFSVDEFSRAIMAKIVKKCGTRDYWEDWATNIADIAKNHITRLTGILKDPDTPARKAFDDFLEELRDDLNETITEADAIEMLAQHIITRPVFQVLFEGHQFTSENPVSRAMQRVLDVLNEANLDKESKDLEKFYASVKLRAEGISDPSAKQNLVKELYEKFFKRAFPRTTDKFGIVYTPVEIVDFVIHSVNAVLQREFDQTLGSEGVHIIDPFTGTGTFITRLLQSGLIAPEEMEHKFRKEIHANEIVLLAYYIAAINIEAVFHGQQGGDYVPFEGICLTDTFRMYESDDLISHYMPDNSERRKRQKATDIRVILGNPPYSKGQESANDDNANVEYPGLDGRIRDTYAALTEAQNKNGLYNSYLRAFRWASDRIGDDGGVVAFITNGGWLSGNTAAGVRKSFATEFTDLYVFNLRGDASLTGERRRREKGNVFGAGTRTPITISVLVRNPESAHRGRIHYRDIGDYLEEKEKLSIIRDFGSIDGIAHVDGWTEIEPDEHGDWINQREGSFDQFIKIGDKKDKTAETLFDVYSSGVKTQRDTWCFNRSRSGLERNVSSLIDTYNGELERRRAAQEASQPVPDLLTDPKQTNWTRALLKDFERGKKLDLDEGKFVPAIYRPFSKEWLFFSRRLNEMIYKMSVVFPDGDTENRAICVSAPGHAAGFTAIMTDSIVELCVSAMKGGTQCFPLHIYDEADAESDDLFADNTPIARRDGITNEGLSHFQAAYPSEAVTKEDIFYYTYGLLHSEDYRNLYGDNLTKELPRIPCVKKAGDFRAFAQAGRDLAELHVGYENVEPYPVTFKQGDRRTWVYDDAEAFFRVTKMQYAGKRPNLDKSSVVYNANITMQDIPLEAYEYVVNGKPALEWVRERQGVLKDNYNPKTKKGSDIVNDANSYAVETMKNPAYPLELFQRVITVSLETMKIVRGLPKLEIDT
ncbi:MULTISPECIES: DEAD/DEAH box helicase [Phaeobacter]|uniref:Helicase n=3 Tax=Phaeobacter TaxID=302485 RepID=A0AAD0EF33_9RHOB|nr:MULTISPECIES: type ISP restriction/modification enzyme [Phaeobacter]AHD12007.1 putative helicase [Phaeobacter gallaeciensis DSM 26640]ATE99560.1 putative helicase [Phaeobacter gallaeciensis]ATF08150.1 putative helicase [Phaeobacter gallaeciensis]ATG45878.1 putative helicase [Phaeobacter piscinae]AUR01820.1 putative helicase [Phaeobacter inhibens]